MYICAAVTRVSYPGLVLSSSGATVSASLGDRCLHECLLSSVDEPGIGTTERMARWSVMWLEKRGLVDSWNLVTLINSGGGESVPRLESDRRGYYQEPGQYWPVCWRVVSSTGDPVAPSCQPKTGVTIGWRAAVDVQRVELWQPTRVGVAITHWPAGQARWHDPVWRPALPPTPVLRTWRFGKTNVWALWRLVAAGLHRW